MPSGGSFLERCDPRAKLIALLLFMPLLFAQSVVCLGWGVAALLALLLIQTAPVTLWHALLRQLWRLRWLFITLLLLHGLLTPGRPVWHGWEALTWEGLREGGAQTVRLVVLVSLAWVMVRATTPLQWVVGLYRLLGGLERLGVPIRAWCAIIAFSLGCIPHLVQEARRVGEDLDWRLVSPTLARWPARLQRTVRGGEALLFRLLQAARGQEEALQVRGMTQGLPFVILQHTVLGWRDLLLLSMPVTGWML
ncbi:MAG: energy-coupling factor transporter transmembrane protein EcfT [Magnetococcus sp. DMHC-8]